MPPFAGFTDSETFTPIPDSFFQQLLNEIGDTDELKITLHALWRIQRSEAPVRFLRAEDFKGLVSKVEPALAKAVARGTLLGVSSNAETIYFINSPRGRAAAEALQAGTLDLTSQSPATEPLVRPNLFTLYEENIGPLTPLIADMLKDTEQTYSEEWVAEALQIAVKSNKRNWRYIEAILKRWKEEGHAQKQDGRNAPQDGRRYVEGEYADYIEH